MRYHIVPLGCQMNQSDAERIRTVLEGMGYEQCDREEDADLLGVISCSVRQRAIDKVYSRIHRWNQWKKTRPILTFVSGCILPEDREKLLKRFDLLFTINDLPDVPEMIRQYGVVTAAGGTGGAPRHLYVPTASGGPHGTPWDIREGFWQVPPSYSSTIEAYVPIQNGCDKFCTFCAVPYTRGREVSRRSDEILQEVRDLVDAGYRTITLLGQNVNSYGLDQRSSEVRFSELLHMIGRETRGAQLWVYFTSPHPRDMGDDVLEAIAEHPVLANQIHLPIQSGDDKVLIRMNRNYRVAGYRRVVESVRRILPDATLFTDIIVGFTGETEEQFHHTRQAMEEFRYNMAYIAQYSPRPGAASSRWADDVPHEEKRRRLHLLTEVLERTAGEYTAQLAGREVTVLVDGRDRTPGFLSGKTEGRIPVRIPETPGVAPGDFVTVRVTATRPLSIAGEVVRPAASTPTSASASPSTSASAGVS